MKDLVAVQPNFEIYVNAFGAPGKIDIPGVIRRRDYYGTADVNVVADELVADGVTPITALEFTRYQMEYTESYRPAKSNRLDVRILAKDIDTALAMALTWITERPRITLDQHTEAELAAFHEELRAVEQQLWREKRGL